MKIASAQINCTVGHIQSNLEEHCSLIETAIAEGVELIAFPEMSITGYCREEGKEMAFTENDPRLDQLKQLATNGNIHIIAGAPILKLDKLYIGAFVIYPNKPTAIYTKQYLHDGEELYYASSRDFNPIIQLGQEKISLAICADINNEDHPRVSSKNGSTIYIPCIFYSKDGMGKGKELLGAYSKDYSLNILMSNYTGELWNMEAGGESAFWTSDGKRCGHLDSNETGLLIAEKSGEEWTTKRK